ncbi:MAG TPA: CopG family transcriptional regulator [Thermoanaerobaculia bacterium]
MRTTTLHLDDDLARAVETQARRSGRTPDEVIQKVLKEVFLVRKAEKPYKLRWSTVKGEAPPTVDISDRDALINHMEGRS